MLGSGELISKEETESDKLMAASEPVQFSVKLFTVIAIFQ